MNKHSRPQGKGLMQRVLFIVLAVGLIAGAFELFYVIPFDLQYVDTSFITEQPCAPPCWQGLILNESTTEQVNQKLEAMAFIDTESITLQMDAATFDPSDGTILYDCKRSDHGICGRVEVADGVLKLANHWIQYRLTLRDLVNKLGEPENVKYRSITYVRSDGCTLIFDWPERSISASYYTDARRCVALEEGKPLKPNERIFSITYQVPEKFDQSPCRKPDCVPWPGLK